jgi:CBS domain-containing protein
VAGDVPRRDPAEIWHDEWDATEELNGVKVAEIMTSPVVTVGEESLLGEVAAVMFEKHIGGVPVLDDEGGLVGIVTDSDFTGRERYVPFAYPTVKAPEVFGRWLAGSSFEELCEQARRLPVAEVMSSPVITAEEEEPVEAVVERMLEHDVSRVPVLRDGVLVGIVARHDLLKLVLPGTRKAAGG